MFYVYVYYHPETKVPFYIGKGSGDRFKKHLFETKENTENYKKWAYIQGLRNKGLEPIIEKVFETTDENAAYDEEMRLIKLYGRRDLDEHGILTNICEDSRPPKRTRALTEEHKKKISNAHKGHTAYNPDYKHSKETKQKISLANKGKPGHMAGKLHTEESKQKIANSNKEAWTDVKRKEASKRMLGKKFTEEHKKNLSESHKGYIASDETKKKMSDSQKLASVERSKVVSEKLKGKPWSDARRAAQLKRKTNGI